MIVSLPSNPPTMKTTPPNVPDQPPARQTVTDSPSVFMLWFAPIVREIDQGSATFEYWVSGKVPSNPTETQYGGKPSFMAHTTAISLFG